MLEKQAEESTELGPLPGTFYCRKESHTLQGVHGLMIKEKKHVLSIWLSRFACLQLDSNFQPRNTAKGGPGYDFSPLFYSFLKLRIDDASI